MALKKVTIKRAKRSKKDASFKEKLLAGLGLGATIVGGAGLVNSKPSSTQFVRANKAEEGSKTKKIKDSLTEVFGIE